jgi:hypothetical protein
VATSRNAIQTLADVVLAGILAVRETLGRVPGLDVEHIEAGDWKHLEVEYGVLHLYLLSEHAHQVIEEAAAQSVIGEIADRISHGLAAQLATTRPEQRQITQWFGETLKTRFAAYRKLPMVVDPESGELVEVKDFERVRQTVFGSFVEALVPWLAHGPGKSLAAHAVLELWLDSLSRSEGWFRIYAPLLDLVAARIRADPEGAIAALKAES